MPFPHKIAESYAQGGPVYSFEFFPPKTDKGADNLMRTAAELKDLVEPDFVSVTYGAGGSTRERTHSVVTNIQKELGLTTMAHQTCVAATKDEVLKGVERLVQDGVINLLALRGDRPQEEDFTPPADGFLHATDLIGFLKEHFDVSIGAACYPENHPESVGPDDDMQWTVEKVRLGAQFLITQLFFDNQDYLDYVERARAAGISVPIVPGIMPVSNVAQVERFTKMCGARLPEALLERLRPVQDDPGAVMAIGIEHAIAQCRGLLESGAPGLHFYTLNKSHATRSILSAIRAM
ncbi:MAG: methylenetetrahydrofolate reductase (NADPH) [Planctomycetota bacterium]|jgi:methylenetetrahydrofolate reductase (NADPH)